MIEGLIGWLILAQTVRWSHWWVTAISWAVFGGLAAGWAWRRRRAALWAVWRSPLLPVAGAALLSAAINGGWWSRVADWALYAVALAYLVDQTNLVSERNQVCGRNLVFERVGWVIIGVCLFEWVGLLMLGGDKGWRVHLLGNSNVIAALLLIVLPLGCSPPRGGGAWWWGLGLAALLSTGSRAGLLGLALYGLVYLVERFKVRRGWIVAPGLAALAVLMAARMAGTTDRIEIYRQAVELFVDHPLAGIGPGQYRGTIIRPLVMVGSWHCVPMYTLVHAHNLALTTAAELGIVGLAGWALAAWRARVWRFDRLAHLAALAPFFVVDDMTMYWLVMLGVFYLVAREVRT